MNFNKQVEAEHYNFTNYLSRKKWNSIYYQIDEINKLNPDSILEIGVGTGILKLIMKNYFNFNYESIDIDEKLNPNHIGSVLELPFSDNKYDVICCFQVLEHIPYEYFQTALSEIFRVAKKSVLISLPDTGKVLKFHIPKFFKMKLYPLPFLTIKKKHVFDGEHYWEINKKGYEIKEIINKMTEISNRNNFILDKEYQIWEFPYHHFFCFHTDK